MFFNKTSLSQGKFFCFENRFVVLSARKWACNNYDTSTDNYSHIALEIRYAYRMGSYAAESSAVYQPMR